MLNLSLDVVAVFGLITAIGALIMAYAANARLRQQLGQQQETLRSLQADMAAMCSGAVKVGERLAQVEQRSERLSRRQDELESQDTNGQHYRHAVKLMGKGAQLDEVIEDCGLARGEAELLELAQKLDQAS